MLFRRFLQCLQHDAALHHHRALQRIDRFDLIEPLQRNHHVAFGGQCTLHQTGQPAVRDYRLVMRMTDGHGDTDLLRAARPHQHIGADPVTPPDARRARVDILIQQHAIGTERLYQGPCHSAGAVYRLCFGHCASFYVRPVYLTAVTRN